MVGGLGGFTKEAIDLEAQLHSQFHSLRRVFQAHSKASWRKGSSDRGGWGIHMLPCIDTGGCSRACTRVRALIRSQLTPPIPLPAQSKQKKGGRRPDLAGAAGEGVAGWGGPGVAGVRAGGGPFRRGMCVRVCLCACAWVVRVGIWGHVAAGPRTFCPWIALTRHTSHAPLLNRHLRGDRGALVLPGKGGLRGRGAGEGHLRGTKRARMRRLDPFD